MQDTLNYDESVDRIPQHKFFSQIISLKLANMKVIY